ncbi:phenylalanine--tRNA ligase subunit beta [Candidatus Microgenomates bacterium]|nr:phenylalanine--tRNA ligase subunit beta [Candidatus Microgenomates bacterium]
MDILVPDNWLRQFLKTKATKDDIAKYLSLSGPSVERILNPDKYPTYAIEVTTNRVDSASVYGIAREASAILPRFGIKAELLPLKIKSQQKLSKKAPYLKLDVDFNLCTRSTAILIQDVEVKPSPKHIQERLIAVGVRPINNVVDISNYIMHELGQPMHTFDYDKIGKSQMVLRESKRGEKIITLDGLSYTLSDGDIAIEDGNGIIIDLPGIMGGQNSMVDEKTKNVLLFVQTYEPAHIRKTSMQLAKRSESSSLYEKGLDPELVEQATRQAIDLFVELTNGKPEKQILDIYPKPYKTKAINLSKGFIEERLGIQLTKPQITDTLVPLGFGVTWQKDNLEVSIPSYRTKDVDIPEDIVEEVARIYGYYNIPNKIMSGELPVIHLDTPFRFETKVRNFLKGVGGVEIYTLSLVSKDQINEKSLKLKNPLGTDTEYLRTSLRPSLVKALEDNSHIKDSFFLYELSNVYIPRNSDLPQEKMYLGVIFSKFSYKQAKGILEALLDELNIVYKLEIKDSDLFEPGHRLVVTTKEEIGQFGVLSSGETYFDLDLENLKNYSRDVTAFKPLAKYPAQIEDITFVLPEKTMVGQVISSIKEEKLIPEVELKDIYNDSYTFRFWYQNPDKTLINKEVEKIRQKVIKNLSKKFGAIVKS